MKEFIEKLIGRLEEIKTYYAEDFSQGYSCEVDCVEKYEVKKIVNQLAEEYINTSTDTSTDTSSGWIACSERLPDTEHISGVSETVLVTTDNNSIFTAEYHRDGKWLDDVADWSLEVIAWQPLPAPYKEGE